MRTCFKIYLTVDRITADSYIKRGVLCVSVVIRYALHLQPASFSGALRRCLPTVHGSVQYNNSLLLLLITIRALEQIEGVMEEEEEDEEGVNAVSSSV